MGLAGGLRSCFTTHKTSISLNTAISSHHYPVISFYMTSPSTIEAAPIAKIEELDSVLNGLEILKTNSGYTTDAKWRHWMTGVSMK